MRIKSWLSFSPKLTSLAVLCSEMFCSGLQAQRSLRCQARLPLQLNIVCSLATVCLLTVSAANSLSAQELNASDGAAIDNFGQSVSLSGNIGLIAADRDDDNGNDSGSAYVFRDLDTAIGIINESAKLTASDGATDDSFSFSVSLSGNIGLFGANEDDDNGSNSGSAYVFRDLDTATGNINESVKLTASDGAPGDGFGISVSLSGNIGLIGALADDDNGSGSGSAYVFRDLDTATGNINESVKLTASDGATNDLFGISVSLSGNIGLIGSFLDDDNGFSSGSAYVFRDLDTASGIINQSVKLIASDAATDDEFGFSVSLSGNIGLIGATGDNISNVPGLPNDTGSAYVFRDLDTATGIINQSVKLIASDAANDDFFGSSVSLSGNIGLIGALQTNGSPFGFISGSAYVFRDLDTATGIINESVKLTGSDGAFSAIFGNSVSLNGDRFTIGARFGEGSIANSGTAYTGTVSSVTTLDTGNSSATVDGISFESRTDWIIGETTSGNMVTLTADDSANITEAGMSVFIGANASSNDNRLVIDGSIEANEVVIGDTLNFGNELVLNDTAENLIDTITLFENNLLTLEGEFTSFALLDSALGSTELFVAFSDATGLITAANFDSLLLTTFDSGTGFTTFTPVPETSSTVLPPAGLTVFRGIQIGGEIGDLEQADNVFVSFNPGFILNIQEAPVWTIFDANLPFVPATLNFEIESQANTPALTKTTELFNFTTGDFDTVDVESESFNADSIVNVDLTDDIPLYVQDGSNAISSRVGWRRNGFTIVFPWEVRIDRAVWILNQ